MSDRYHSITLILAKDLRDDDAEGLIEAARHLRGVIEVKPNVSNPTDCIAQERARSGLIAKLYEVLK